MSPPASRPGATIPQLAQPEAGRHPPRRTWPESRRRAGVSVPAGPAPAAGPAASAGPRDVAAARRGRRPSCHLGAPRPPPPSRPSPAAARGRAAAAQLRQQPVDARPHGVAGAGARLHPPRRRSSSSQPGRGGRALLHQPLPPSAPTRISCGALDDLDGECVECSLVCDHEPRCGRRAAPPTRPNVPAPGPSARLLQRPHARGRAPPARAPSPAPASARASVPSPGPALDDPAELAPAASAARVARRPRPTTPAEIYEQTRTRAMSPTSSATSTCWRGVWRLGRPLALVRMDCVGTGATVHWSSRRSPRRTATRRGLPHPPEEPYSTG